MPAAIALAVVLVIAVAGASMALESQRAPNAPRRPVRPPRRPPEGDPGRRPLRTRQRSVPDPTAADGPPSPPPPATEPEVKPPELLRTGVPARARVASVVDERTIGPVTRSRLVLKIDPEDGEAFEVTVRHAFQTPADRAQVKVGGMVAVRYDPDDRRRVVLDVSPG